MDIKEKRQEIDNYLLNQVLVIWRAGNCTKFKPDEAPIENFKYVVASWKKYLRSQGVVIKVDSELPTNKFLPMIMNNPLSMTVADAVQCYKEEVHKAGFTATEPLIEEE